METRGMKGIGFLSLVLVAATALCAGPACAAPAGERVKLDVLLSNPTVLAGGPRTTYLKVGLTGAPLEVVGQRAPVNLALVLDRSGSMSGEKIWRLKEAAKVAVDRLSPEDVISIVAYNHTVQVLVPATKARDRYALHAAIDSLFAGGNTALFAGVARGASEVRKFLERNQVNRVVLLSDGLANVGPSSTGDLAQFGRSLAREGISVTTIGLGNDYNEDLMVELARAGEGNHAFAASGSDLARIFDLELGDVLSVVARDVKIIIRLAPGCRPVRVLGRQADIRGPEVVTSLAQVYAKQEKYVLIEVELPGGAVGAVRDVATVEARYADPVSRSSGQVAAKTFVSYTDAWDRVERETNPAVAAASVEMIATDNNRAAMVLRDQGRIEEARQKLRANTDYLKQNAAKYKSPKLDKLSTGNDADLENVDKPTWNKQRKAMIKRQYEFDSQQAW